MLARAIRGCALAALCLVAIGCGGASESACARRGIVWLSWTVRGQPVSDASCRGIDHLVLQLEGNCGSVVIDPIPCLRGLGWEYDSLPEGSSAALLGAVDTRGFFTLHGGAAVDVTAVKPATTTAIDLR